MKTKNLSTFFLFFYSFILAEPLAPQDPTFEYHDQAEQWAQKVLINVDSAYIQELLALVHASYTRSHMTLLIQRDYLELLQRIGSGWDHVISTRLNPSKDEDFDPAYISVDDTLMHQLETFSQTCAAQKSYANILDRLADDTHPEYPVLNYRPCRKLIDELRENARNTVAQTLIAAIDEIQQEIQKAQEMISQAAELFKNQGQLKNGELLNRSVTELLWYYAPSLMVKSFVNFDAGYTAGSKQCLNAYFESQQLGNQIWHRIETARAAFYAAHYCALYNAVLTTHPELAQTQDPSLLIQQLTDYTCSI